MKMTKNKTAALIGITALTAGVLAAQAGNSLYSSFSHTTGQTTGVSTGTLEIGDFGDGSTDNEPGTDPSDGDFSYTVHVADLWPGDVAYRFFNIKNKGSANIGQLQLKTVTTGALADVAPPVKNYPAQIPNQATTVNGRGGKPVLMTLAGCSEPWVYDGTAAPVCPGSSNTYYSNRAANLTNNQSLLAYSVVRTDTTTLVVSPVTSGASYVQPYGSAMSNGFKSQSSIYFMTKYELPNSSTNEYQGTSMRVDWSAIAKQHP